MIADLARRDQQVAGDELAVAFDEDLAVRGDDHHVDADELTWDRVAGRADPDRRELVDPSPFTTAQRWPQRRQRPQQLPFLDEPIIGDRGDRRVLPGVDLRAPRPARVVRLGLARPHVGGDDQVLLRVAAKGFDHALGLRVGRFAEVRPEPVVRREAHELRRRHDNVGDDAALQAAHAIREHDLRGAAETLEALGQQPHRRGRLLVAGDTHEPPPRPRKHGAEHLPAALGRPVDHQMLTRCRHPRPEHPPLPTPPPLRVRDRATEVPRRTLVAGGLCDRQQPLRRDPTISRLDLVVDHRRAPRRCSAAQPRRGARHRHAGAVRLDHPLNRLVSRAAQRGRAPIGPHLLKGGDDVHPFPR